MHGEMIATNPGRGFEPIGKVRCSNSEPIGSVIASTRNAFVSWRQKTVGERCIYVELANDFPYGLSGFVYGEDEAVTRRVVKELQVGQISVNGASYFRIIPRLEVTSILTSEEYEE